MSSIRRLSATLILTGLIAAPGLAADREYGPIDRLEENLREQLSVTGAGTLVPISIVLREQSTRAETQRAGAGLNKAARRDAVLTYLKDVFRTRSAGLMTAIDVELQRGAVDDVRSIWIGGVVALEATPAAIYRLARRSEVGRINWDQPVGEEIFPVQPSENPGSIIAGAAVIECGTELMNAPDVWNTHGFTGAGVVVAVIDTGTCVEHPDLADHLWTNPGEIAGNGVDDDSNGYVDDILGWDFENNDNDPDDGNSHGTHTAGTVLGDGTNGQQTGVAPDASLMTLRIWNNFSGESVVWEAMQYAADNDAHVISVSLGWPHSVSPDRATWRGVCEATIDAGVVVVYAGGNEGDFNGPVDNIRTPGDVPDVITVGAVDCGDGLADFSSIGPVTWESVAPYFDHPYPPGLIKPTVAGPGVDTLSTSSFDCSTYITKSGTSMATPHVAGAVALMLQANPTLDHFEVSQALQDTAVDLGAPGMDNAYGAGRVDALAAVELVMITTSPADIDGDGDVDFNDLVELLGAWGPCPPPPSMCLADIDNDGQVGFSDLVVLLAEWS